MQQFMDQISNFYYRILYILITKLIHWSFYRLLLKDRSFDWENALLSFVFTIAAAVGLGFLMKLAIEYLTHEIEIITFVLESILVLLNLI